MKMFDRDDFRYSFFDGMCANVYGTLTGGVFLTGFALYLGMNDLMIGVMMSIPHLVALFQLPGSYYICRKGRRKTIAYWAATIARMMWLPILAVGLLPLQLDTFRPLLVVILFLILQSFTSVSYIAWISWTSDLVPDEIRGSFFGMRNMLCGAAGITAVLIFGNLLDIFRAGLGKSTLIFLVPFGFAVVFGLISSHYLKRISDAPAPPFNGKGLFQELLGPIKDENFRKYLLFALCWNFSVHMAAPFFSLYFLRELKYSYAFVAVLTTIAALLDIVGMRLWGAVSDQVKNKTVIRLAGWGVVFLPALWVLVRPRDLLMPMAIQVLSGGFWAGVNLCNNNLQLSISPREDRVWYLSAYSITAGMGAAVAPIVGGFILSFLNRHAPASTAGGLIPLHYLFIASSVLRMLGMIILNLVHEPHEGSIRQAVFLFFNMYRSRRAAAGQTKTAAVQELSADIPKVNFFTRAFKRPMVRDPM